MTDHFHSLLIKVRGADESYVLVGNSEHIVRDTEEGCNTMVIGLII